MLMIKNSPYTGKLLNGFSLENIYWKLSGTTALCLEKKVTQGCFGQLMRMFVAQPAESRPQGSPRTQWKVLFPTTVS